MLQKQAELMGANAFEMNLESGRLGLLRRHSDDRRGSHVTNQVLVEEGRKIVEDPIPMLHPLRGSFV